jgi:hypothetical protein
VHQVGLKDYGIQNFSFLAFKGEAVGVTQIPSHTGAWQTENFFSLKSCFLAIKSPKTWKSTIKKFHFSRHETNTSLIFHMWQVKIPCPIHLFFDKSSFGDLIENLSNYQIFCRKKVIVAGGSLLGCQKVNWVQCAVKISTSWTWAVIFSMATGDVQRNRIIKSEQGVSNIFLPKRFIFIFVSFLFVSGLFRFVSVSEEYRFVSFRFKNLKFIFRSVSFRFRKLCVSCVSFRFVSFRS